MIVTPVNFIEREPLALTYRRMVLVGSSLVGLAILVFAGLVGQGFWLHQEVTRVTEEIERLKERRDRILSEVTQEAGSGSLLAHERVRKGFERSPDWGGLLQFLSLKLPPSLWLASIKTEDKEASRSAKGLILEGEATSAQAVSRLVELLNRDSQFSQVLLSSLTRERGQQETPDYRFTLETFLEPGGGR